MINYRFYFSHKLVGTAVSMVSHRKDDTLVIADKTYKIYSMKYTYDMKEKNLKFVSAYIEEY